MLARARFAATLWADHVESLRHHISQVSLMSGWAPVAMQAITAVVVACAIGWRPRRWRRIPVASLAGLVLAACAHWYIGSVGVAGDPAPRALWVWIAFTGLAAAVLVLGWAGIRWWLRGVSVLAVLLCLLSCALTINLWVGYFPTVHTAWNQLTAGPLPGQTDRATVTAMQLTGARPTKGVVVPVTISADASRFQHRRELVYLPPAWFARNPPPPLPTVMMIAAELNTPADWLRAGNAVNIIDDFASANGGYAPVLVFVDPTGAFDNDTECVNGSRGNAALHLTKDVVPYMISNFGVSADRDNWGIVGWSMGGTCAVDLTVTRPEMFSAFVDIAGDVGPNSGNREQTIARLFGGNTDAWAAFDPATVMTRHGPYTGVSGLFEVPGTPNTSDGPDAAANPEGQDGAANSLCALGGASGIHCAVAAQPGKHDWPFAAQAFAFALPWLAGQLETPGVQRAAMPGVTPSPVSSIETVGPQKWQSAGR